MIEALFLAALLLCMQGESSRLAISGDPLTGSGEVSRSHLLAEQLLDPQDARDDPGTTARVFPAGPVNDDAYALPAAAAPPAHRFEGTLELFGERYETHRAHRDTFLRSDQSANRQIPRLSIDFTQSGSYLIPVDQGLRYTGHSRWNVIVGPGRIWSERGDRGWSRASVPFALVERNQNCTHNGVFSFLFDGKTTSPAAFQITQETCLYYQFDLWGVTAAAYSVSSIPEASSVRDTFAREVAARLPTKPLSALAEDYPRARINWRAFGDGLDPAYLTAYGLVYDRVHYVAETRTRTGVYPFPESLRLPSYSTAKTAFAGIAMLYLAERFGEEIFERRLRDFIPKVPSRALKDVTFEHALDMATGYYRDAEEQLDERDMVTETGFFLGENERQKLRTALGYPFREEPGKRWVYHTTDTFLLVKALTGYIESQGLEPDLFDLIVDEIYRPLGLSQGAFESLRTGNRATGLPFGGFGLFWTRDDIGKVATFLQADQGRIGDRQLLHPAQLAATMQRDPKDRGLDALHLGRPTRYNNGLWARRLDVADGAEGSRSIWLLQMLGYGGIAVNMLPNGATYYYFGDNNEHSWRRAVREASKLPPSRRER